MATGMPPVTMLRCMLLVGALLLDGGARAQSAGADTAESAVRAFHEALRSGDVAAVRRLLAPGAVILEGGERESREAYLSHHLKADIEFARAVTTRSGALETSVNGDVAWVSSTSVSSGTFRHRPVNLVGAELVVLTRSATEWQIQAVHWSSRRAR